MFRWINLTLFIIGLAAIVITINFFARHADWRYQIDATKTRAFTLSDSTSQLLGTLEGPWKIALVMSQAHADRAMRRQIDEVLQRYTDASPHITVTRIDPDDPLTLREYDRMLWDLQNVYKDPVNQYNRALDDGLDAIAALRELAEQSAPLEQLVLQLSAHEPMRAQLEQHLNLISLLPDQCATIDVEVGKSRRTDQSRALPDFEAARSILAYALSQAAVELDETSQTFARVLQRPSLPEAIRSIGSTAQRDYQQLSQRLAAAADPLKRLPPLELGTIGQQLQQGEAAVIISPQRAALIPSAQLFPKSNLQTTKEGGVSFDQRFRGEQLISAAIRSLTVEHMPLVVFVHGESSSMLRPRERQADFVGAALALRASRFEVAEWIPAQSPERPTGDKGQPVVWVIVPPAQRQGLELTKEEAALLDAARELIVAGQNVMLSVYPSMLTKYGQSDPWAELAAPWGVRCDTSAVILESIRVGQNQTTIERGQAVSEFASDHVIARALNGLQAYFTFPIAIQLTDTPGQTASRSAIAAITAKPDRWLDKDWAANLKNPDASGDREPLKQTLPIAVATHRPGPTGQGTQRLVLIGSGSWLMSFVADVERPVGGGRIARVNPGNYELMFASAFWLAGMDELIAASPTSQEVQPLQNISAGAQKFWRLVVVLALPLACVSLGAAVWVMRRT